MSCSTYKRFETVIYQPFEYTISCYIEIPKGYEIRIVRVTWEYEYKYIYSDKSWIYISNFESAVNSNYKNLRALGDSIFEYRFQNIESAKATNKALGKDVYKIAPDTMELSGIDSNNLYWKDIKIGELSIGYCGVSNRRKEIYDNALKSFRIGE